MNREARDNGDKDEGNWPIPNLWEQVNIDRKPARDRRIKAQTRKQTQYPTGQIKHPENEAAPVPGEHAQKHEHQKKDVDHVENHLCNPATVQFNSSLDDKMNLFAPLGRICAA